MKQFSQIAALALTASAFTLAQAQTTAVVAQPVASLKQQVMETERAFAKSMFERNHQAFSSFLAPDAVFFSGAQATSGKAAVAKLWQAYFEKPQAPFSWQPELVEVLESGNLALSSGPVFNPAGKKVATFTSIWRLEAPGVWRIVFDKGNNECDCK